MREILNALSAGEIGVSEAESRLAGYATTDAGRFDAARERRRGIPEAILATGKTPAEIASLTTTAVSTTGRALVTRATPDDAAAIQAAFNTQDDAERAAGTASASEIEASTNAHTGDADATVEYSERTRTVVVRTEAFEPPTLSATVAVVAAGTADAAAAGEAAVVASEIGATVDRIDDVGVANIDRILDQRDRIRESDVVIVAAGREGALPTVVAGLVNAPVIALPVSTGYGMGGEGTAALQGALQSCSVLTTVNIDAGFVAGAQAGLIARAVDSAREAGTDDTADTERI